MLFVKGDIIDHRLTHLEITQRRLALHKRVCCASVYGPGEGRGEMERVASMTHDSVIMTLAS